MADGDALENARTLREALATVLKGAYLYAGEWGRTTSSTGAPRC
jgi:hypothetical protein